MDLGTLSLKLALEGAESITSGLESLTTQTESAGDSAETAGASFTDVLGSSLENIKGQAESSASSFLQTKLGLDQTTASTIVASGEFLGLVGVMAQVVSGLWDVANEAASTADEIDKASQKAYMSSESYQNLSSYWEMCGSSASMMTKESRTLQTALQGCTDEASYNESAFGQLGISWSEMSAMTPEDQLIATVQALQNMSDETERNSVATDLFGSKLASEMQPMLNDTSANMQEMLSYYEQYGTVSEEGVSAGAEFEDSLTMINTAIDTAKTNLGLIVTSAFQPLLDFITSTAIPALSQLGEMFGPTFQTIGDIVGTAFNTICTVWSSTLQPLVPVISVAFQGLATVVNSSMSILGTVVTGVFNTISAVYSGILAPVFSTIASALSTLGSKFSSVFNGIQSVVSSVCGTISGVINGVISVINGLKDGLANLASSALEKLSSIGHRTGLREVPYDGYLATLHKGEMILTSAEANQYQNGNYGNGDKSEYSLVVNNYSPKSLSATETARLYRKTQRRIRLGMEG